MGVDAGAAALIGAGIGGVAGIAGGVGAAVLTARATRGNWLRDRRLAAFADFVAIASRHHHALVLIWREGNDRKRVELWQDVSQEQGELHRAKRLVRLLGPAGVAAAADELVRGHEQLTDAVAAKASGEAWPLHDHQASRRIAELGTAFDAAANDAVS